MGRPFEARGLLPGHGINPSLGPPLATSCCKGSWKKTPYSERACARLRLTINRAMEPVAGAAALTVQQSNPVAFHASIWHKPERVTVLLPGPYASGMTHPSLQGCTRGVSWKEYGHSKPARARLKRESHWVGLLNAAIGCALHRFHGAGDSASQSGTSRFGARGLLPGPFATRCCKRRPQGRVHAGSWKRTPCFEQAPQLSSTPLM